MPRQIVTPQLATRRPISENGRRKKPHERAGGQTTRQLLVFNTQVKLGKHLLQHVPRQHKLPDNIRHRRFASFCPVDFAVSVLLRPPVERSDLMFRLASVRCCAVERKSTTTIEANGCVRVCVQGAPCTSHRTPICVTFHN